MSRPETSYYDRVSTTLVDGSRAFANDTDRAHEHAAAEIIGHAWSCEVHHFGAFSAVDFYATRGHKVVAVLELKARTHRSERYPSVFLNVRKWLALQLAANGMGVPAIYVVQFTDRLMWAPVHEIDASRVRVGGCRSVVKSHNDVEPVIDVDVSTLRTLKRAEPPADASELFDEYALPVDTEMPPSEDAGGQYDGAVFG